jgi:tetratricopeptide (TPR) repeat protein
MKNSRGLLGVSIVALGTLLLGLTPYPRASTAALREAQSARSRGQLGTALRAYDQAIRLDPKSPLPWLGSGVVLLEQHRFDRAAVFLQEAERLGAGHDALLALGRSYAGRGNWTVAIQLWLYARAFAPDDGRVYIALAEGSIAQGLFDQAVSLLQQGLERQLSDDQAAVAHGLLGRLLAGDDPARAAYHLMQAGDDDMLAVLNATEAEEAPARRALLLGVAFLQRDEFTLARRQFERATALDPAQAEAYAYLGQVLDRLGATAEARDTLAHALNLDPDSALTYYFLGLHDLQVGLLNGAQAALWEALTRDPENAAARVAMGQTFVDLGDYAQAEEWYQGAVEAAPDDIEFHLLLVHFYLDHLYRIADAGIPAAQAALALAPDDARALDLLGWAYQLASRPAESERTLIQALALDPDLASAQYHLGSVLARAGRQDQARQHLQRAADLDAAGYYGQRAEALLANLTP